MNPPTPGHLELIRELIEKAVKMNAPKVYVILSKTINNSDNPIECPSKKPVLEEMVARLKETMKPEPPQDQQPQIDNIEVVFKCVDPEEKSPISTISSIVSGYNAPNLDLFLIVGDDRAELLDTMEKLFGKKVRSVGGQILEREEMESYKNMGVNELSELVISEVPISAFSASFVRNLVKNNLKGKFDEVYRPYLSQELIDKLHSEIQAGFAREPPVKKGTKRKEPPTGGRKRSTTSKKSKKHKKSTRKNTRKNTRKYSRKRH